jgi:PelA/Pel-15E family pectate lyase
MKSARLAAYLFFGALVPALCLSGAVVGTNPPAQPLTPARIQDLPPSDQAPWHQFLARSKRQHAIDGALLADELKAANLAAPLVPPKGGELPLQQPSAWFAGEEARRIANNVVSFQTPAGGWSKNTKWSDHPRQRGERFGNEADYDGTFDNDATTTELRFLAKAISAAVGAETSATWRESFSRGMTFVFSAQYPSGGWPQVWPLVGDYHDSIAFNDGAVLNVITLLRDVAAGRDEFAFVPAEIRTQAARAYDRGLACLLASQIVVEGRRTVWCQQHDPLTLAPVSARAYEMPAQSSSESAAILLFLIELPKPSPEIVTAVHAAATWFKQTVIRDREFGSGAAGDGHRLLSVPGAAPLWARYYEIGRDRPLFGDRDRTIHDNVEEISKERRNNYSWFTTNPKRVLAHYEKWAKTHPVAGK